MARSVRSRRTATMAALAAELGVSRTTVSNAYNRPDQLSPELRERVLDAARRLGYPGPDPVARSLRTRQAGAVGLLLTEALSYAFQDPAAIRFLEGLAIACGDAGRGLLLVPASPDAD
ncbi:MAG: LacI family DNA-binding transcriptional regulator, partial [Pseudonocardiaceae bacterium]